MPENRLAFVFGGTWLAHLPMAIELVRALEREGWKVDVYNADGRSPDIPVSPLHTIAAYPKGRMWPWRMALTQALWRNYSGYVGSSGAGIWCAALLARASRRPVAFLADEIRRLDPVWRRREAWGQRRSEFTIVPDLCRWSYIRELNGLPATAAVFELPNAPRATTDPEVTAAFRRSWGVGEADRCILSMGGLSDRYGVSRFFAAVPALMGLAKVVVHDRVSHDGVYRALAHLLETSHPNLRFSLEPVAYDSVPFLAAAADVGVALYDAAHGPGTALMGKASGKIAYFLANGVPVIHEDLDNLRWITAAGAGLGVRCAPEICPAFERILHDLAAYRERARAAYETHLTPDRHLAAICGEMDAWRRR